MNHVFARTRLILIGLFVVAVAATSYYQFTYLWPMQKCERAGAWWDPRDRQCLTPVPIWRLTGRMPGEVRGVGKP